MLRTKLSLSRILQGLAACCALGVSSTALAGPPQSPGSVEPDYEASGFVVPAGYAEPTASPTTGVMHANMPYGQMPMHSVQQVGFLHGGSGCASPGCDVAGNCSGCGSCDWQCAGGCQTRGLLANLGCNNGCGSGLCNICIFCQGSGCGVCQSIGNFNPMGILAALAPYTDGGLGAQRWYDISAEAVFMKLDHNVAAFNVTSLGPGPNPNIVLRSNDPYDMELEAGIRVSAAMICGVGGNVELTYMGLGEITGRAAVGTLDPAGPANLFSFISNFGQAPPGGFDDTDTSLFQSLQTTQRFHTFDLNYRRRWVGPYSRFQGSWLAGLRYVDLDDQLLYRTVGLNNDTVAANDLRFFNNNMKASNSMFGVQIGGDLWWNVYPGINLGVGAKGALLGNTARVDASVVSNSIGPAGVNFPLGLASVAKGSDTVLMTELTATAIYRFSYSWSFRSSFHGITLDDVVLSAPSLQTQNLTGIGTGAAAAALAPLQHNNDVVLTGVTFGAEYLW